jgi:hypothetical protein
MMRTTPDKFNNLNNSSSISSYIWSWLLYVIMHRALASTLSNMPPQSHLCKVAIVFEILQGSNL